MPRFIRVLAFWAVMLGLRSATADMGTPPRIYSLVQQEQDVIIEIRLGDAQVGWDACRTDGSPCVLTRQGPKGTKTLSDDLLFSLDDADSSEPFCYGDNVSVEYCKDNPAECADCDGDKIKECWTEGEKCNSLYYFKITNKCVPPGENTYTLAFPEGTGDSPIQQDAKTIDVIDNNSNPLNHNSDAEKCQSELDALVNGPEDHQDIGAGGCGTVPVGSGGGLRAAVLLAVVGLWTLSCRRKQTKIKTAP